MHICEGSTKSLEKNFIKIYKCLVFSKYLPKFTYNKALKWFYNYFLFIFIAFPLFLAQKFARFILERGYFAIKNRNNDKYT